MRLPRDLSGAELAALPRRYGYAPTRQTGSHLRVITTALGSEHHVTIPLHAELRVGTLSAIVGEVAGHLGRDKEDVQRDLFGW